VSEKNGKERKIFDPFFSTGYILQAAEGGIGDERQLTQFEPEDFG
jgi:hypothetical protein